MEVEFEWTEEDVAALARLADTFAAAGARNSREDWANRWFGGLIVGLWVVPVAVLGAGLVLEVEIEGRDFGVAVAVSLLWAAALFAKGVWDRRTSAAAAGKQIAAANREYGFLGPVHIEIGPEGVSERGRGYAVEADWQRSGASTGGQSLCSCP